MIKRIAQISLLSLGTLLLFAGSAAATLFGFFNISNNIAGDAAIGEAQLFVDVTDSAGQILFTFSNTGPAASSITDVYFDDGALSGIASMINTVGLVEFTALASPGNLPSANDASPPFVTTMGFSADSDPPTQPLGVNPSESLGILFDLMAGQTIADVVSQLNTGQLRIGIHVQGFASGGSESFVNIIPEPGAVTLFGIGLLVTGQALRRARH